jgi:hypothetical protein
MVSSLEEFRRTTSRVATFVILASIPSFAFSIMLPRKGIVGSILVVLFLVLVLILKVTIRCSAVNSRDAIRVIEGIFYAAVLTSVSWIGYSTWMDGIEGLIPSVIDAVVLIVVTVLVQKKIWQAKSMASQAP